METHIRKMKDQLVSWLSRLEKLTAELDRTGTDEQRKRIRDLKTKHTAAQVKLDDLSTGKKGSWERVRTEIWIIWSELEDALDDFQRSVAKKGKVSRMKDTRKSSTKSKEDKIRTGIRSLPRENRVPTNAAVAYPDFGAKSGRSASTTAPANDQTAEREYDGWKESREPSDEEEP
jgi:ribosomal protein S21